MPASIAAYIISVRASVSAALLTARTRYLPTPFKASVAKPSEKGFAPCDTGRLAPRAGLSRRGHARAVSDSSAWLMQSKPLAATTLRGNVAVTSGSISASVGIRRREMMPVLALISVRLNMAMPVVSEPVPVVVGHAICGFNGPGTFCPPPVGKKRDAREPELARLLAGFCETAGAERERRHADRECLVALLGQCEIGVAAGHCSISSAVEIITVGCRPGSCLRPSRQS